MKLKTPIRFLPFLFSLFILSGCALETQNRVFPKPVFIFSKDYIDYKNEIRWSEQHQPTNNPQPALVDPPAPLTAP